MKVVCYNLGCKVNQYECDSITKALREKGIEVSEKLEKADIYILNTCAVTNEAERKSRQCVERCLKYNSNAKVYVCGCASQHNAEQFINKSNVEFVIGSANKMQLVNSIQKKDEGVLIKDIPLCYEDEYSPTVDRTRGYIKIQDGCNNFCSYCLIPYVRGRSRSRSIDSVFNEVLELQSQTKEIVLTGIDISSFGKDTKESFIELLDKIKDVDIRIRLGSLEVNIITEEFLIALTKLKNFCPQFHLSLQSGCNEILKKMNRHYTTNVYLEKVKLIRKYFKNAGITTDLICGFPTETDENHLETIDFIKTVGFSQMHVFPYSKREGTRASKMVQCDKKIAKERCKEISQIASEMKIEYIKKFIGQKLELLVEDEENGYMTGYSKEYIKCYIEGAQKNSIISVEGIAVKGDILIVKKV